MRQPHGQGQTQEPVVLQSRGHKAAGAVQPTTGGNRQGEVRVSSTTHKVCSESKVQGKIRSVQIILESQIFLDF
jgi:hypothetical protein